MRGLILQLLTTLVVLGGDQTWEPLEKVHSIFSRFLAKVIQLELAVIHLGTHIKSC